MAPHSTMPEQSEADGSSTLSEAKATKHQPNNGTKKLSSATEGDSKKRGNSPLAEARAAKRQKNSGFQKYTSIAGNDSFSIAENDLEFEIEKARFEIFNHFMNLKTQMDNNDEVISKEMETFTGIGLANISEEKTPQNEFFIKCLINNLEEVIRKVGADSKKDLDHTMDDIRKILIKLVNRMKQGFRPSPCVNAVTVSKTDSVTFQWICLGIFAVLMGLFFESAVGFFQSTVLIVILLCILHFFDLSSK